MRAGAIGLDRIVLMVAAHAGLRAGELCGLCRDCVDLKAGTLSVKKSLTELPESKGGPILEEPKTKNARRTLNLPPDVVAELRE
jgi:integrase